METVKIGGKQFLRCQQETCEWNIGWLGKTDWTRESGMGIRVCNLGAKAILEKDTAPPHNCRHWKSVLELASTELSI